MSEGGRGRRDQDPWPLAGGGAHDTRHLARQALRLLQFRSKLARPASSLQRTGQHYAASASCACTSTMQLGRQVLWTLAAQGLAKLFRKLPASQVLLESFQASMQASAGCVL